MGYVDNNIRATLNALFRANGPFYIKGKEHGKWEEYNEEGNLAARCTYHQGERIKEWEFFNHNKK